MLVADTIKQALATPAAFRKWLVQNRNAEYIGVAVNGCGCPIAEWLKFLLGEDNVVTIERRHWKVQGSVSLTGELPYWADRFVFELDRTFGANALVRSSDAISILERLEVAHA